MIKCFFDQKGVALLMVLWVLMLLTVIVGEFCFTMRTHVNITRNFKESTQAYYIAVAGINQAVAQLIQQQVIPRSTLSMDERSESEAIPDWRINTDIAPVSFGNGEYLVRLENESGKVNINLAEKRLMSALLNDFEIDESEKNVIVDSIMDWRDADHNHRMNGAEDDYYQSLPKPYECKDAKFDSIDELLLVRGITPEIFFQKLEKRVTVFPEKQTKRSRKRGKKKRFKNEFDYNKLNINAMPLQLWAALPGMTPELAADIAAYRAEQDFVSLLNVQAIVGPEIFARIAIYLTLQQTPYYTIQSLGKIRDSRISNGVTAVIFLDNHPPKKYRFIQWLDEIPQPMHTGVPIQNRFQ